MKIDDLKGCFANVNDDMLLRENGNLYAENKKLKEENQRLNNDIKVLLKENEAKEKVIIKHDNVLNELEKWVYQFREEHKNDTGIFDKFLTTREVLDKLVELKESVK